MTAELEPHKKKLLLEKDEIQIQAPGTKSLYDHLKERATRLISESISKVTPPPPPT